MPATIKARASEKQEGMYVLLSSLKRAKMN